MQQHIDSYDFAGKKIIPFCTSGVTSVEKASEHMQGIVGEGACVDAGKRIDAGSSEEEVKTWTELLGL